ncbi:MAG: peroxiredoxin [Thermoplasmatota archaeon]
MKEYKRLGDLRIGDNAPGFDLPSSDGGKISFQDLLGKGPIVLYFYPSDDTPGCTKEACSFRDQYEDFTDAGATVIGISSDSLDSHRRFVKKHNLPFTLLSDADDEVRKLYNVPKTFGFIPGRVTFVIDRSGRIRYMFSSQMMAEEHVKRTLKIIEGMRSP